MAIQQQGKAISVLCHSLCFTQGKIENFEPPFMYLWLFLFMMRKFPIDNSLVDFLWTFQFEYGCIIAKKLLKIHIFPLSFHPIIFKMQLSVKQVMAYGSKEKIQTISEQLIWWPAHWGIYTTLGNSLFSFCLVSKAQNMKLHSRNWHISYIIVKRSFDLFLED